jgi:UDP-N-acetylmuramoyl-L-alanyl-D-glutamate--2,6-diaminopimelate ligase
MVENGVSSCVMEASSHGLVQGRLEGCVFSRVGFSNLSPEHLEFHEDMEKYFDAKRKLFTDYVAADWRGAVNADDQFGRRLLREFSANATGFSMRRERGEFYTVSLNRMNIDGITVGVTYPDGRNYDVNSPLLGEYNALNILESIVIADSLGLDAETIKKGVTQCPQVPGRLERFSFTNGVTAFVDYAHSVDGMLQALGALKKVTTGTLRVLWGAGGDRTPVKRPVVGELMARLAGHVVISTDNPRSEDPAAIAHDVERGVKDCGSGVRYEIVLDRGEAIDFILDAAGPGDVVLVAGKGPERYIDYKTHKVPFTDSGAISGWSRRRGVEAPEG